MLEKQPSGNELKISWECVENSASGEYYAAEIVINNCSVYHLASSDWDIYFNTCREIKPKIFDCGLEIVHVNGDLWKIRPLVNFKGLQAGQSIVLPYEGYFWIISEADAPQGFFIVYQNDNSPMVQTMPHLAVKSFLKSKQLSRKKEDIWPVSTSQLRYHENEKISLLEKNEVGRITPAPVHETYSHGLFTISSHTSLIFSDNLHSEAALLSAIIDDIANINLLAESTHQAQIIELTIAPVLLDGDFIVEQAYCLRIDTHKITITGNSAAAVFYGIQSLRQLMPADARSLSVGQIKLPCCQIIDAPRFAYRGLMLDVSRHFSSKETVLRLLECMSLYKLNQFHFHLTDDEGWRLEIPSLPELTEFGSQRGFALDMAKHLLPSFGSGPNKDGHLGSGHYSRSDFIEILQYATQRHIEVIPEINTPAHARAAIKAMNYRYEKLMKEGKSTEALEYLLHDLEDRSSYKSVQLWTDNVICIAQESYYRFLETIIIDVKAMYGEAGAVLSTWHTGGDEVPKGAWEQSPVCHRFMLQNNITTIEELQQYSLCRYREVLARHDLVFAGWEEIALKKTVVNHQQTYQPNLELLNSNVRPYVWNNTWGGGQEDFAYQLANAGYKTVLSNVSNLYFDLAYAKDPSEPGYYWGGFIETRNTFEFCPLDIFSTASVDVMGRSLDPAMLTQKIRLSEIGKKNILGMQGHLWAENIVAAQQLEYFALPRMLALAERAWSKDPGWTLMDNRAERQQKMDEDWNEFINRLSQYELPRLDVLLGGFNYRIASPGVKIEQGKIYANSAFPGYAIRYTVDGSEPNLCSTNYTNAISVDGEVKLALFNQQGRKSKTVIVNSECLS